MCGITGILGADIEPASIARMTAALKHRGPDDFGVWIENPIAFGHRRLSILDLSPLGHQPMVSEHFAIVFNGEIYNFVELREELRRLGHSFRSASDTEVLLAAFEQWGIESALKRANGMFALAVWNRRECTLSLARDRLGEKPLYYGRCGGSFLFASELKALRCHPQFEGKRCLRAARHLLKYGYIPSPLTIYEKVSTLPPGHLMTVRLDGPEMVRPYWSLDNLVAAASSFSGGEEEALEQLDELLLDAVRRRLISDVPLGAFLSGGVDSSLLVALMAQSTGRPVKTYTIGFKERDYDEALYARAVANHLGTEHTDLYIGEQDMLEIVPELPRIYDEPLANPTVIPTILVSRLAHRSVTVALSGEGGDELFVGYNRYIWAERAWNLLRRAPLRWRRALAADRCLPLLKLLRAPSDFARSPDAVEKLRRILPCAGLAEVYDSLVSYWTDSELWALGLPLSDLPSERFGVLADLTERNIWGDVVHYLPDDLLAKIDRASMSVGLEARAPFLDHRVVEFALSLPLSLKAPRGEKKHLLKRILRGHLPADLINRPKMGFSVPIGRWLRGPLRDWAEALLQPSHLESEWGLNSKLVTSRWREHLSGKRNHELALWAVLSLQAWSVGSARRAVVVEVGEGESLRREAL